MLLQDAQSAKPRPKNLTSELNSRTWMKSERIGITRNTKTWSQNLSKTIVNNQKNQNPGRHGPPMSQHPWTSHVAQDSGFSIFSGYFQRFLIGSGIILWYFWLFLLFPIFWYSNLSWSSSRAEGLLWKEACSVWLERGLGHTLSRIPMLSWIASSLWNHANTNQRSGVFSTMSCRDMIAVVI